MDLGACDSLPLRIGNAPGDRRRVNRATQYERQKNRNPRRYGYGPPSVARTRQLYFVVREYHAFDLSHKRITDSAGRWISGLDGHEGPDPSHVIGLVICTYR